MSKVQKWALAIVGIILLIILAIIIMNLTTTETTTGGGSESTKTGGIGKILLGWLGL